MSISTIVTRGFGTFGTIADVVRAGYNSGDSSIISDADAAKIAQYVWKEIVADSYEAQQLMRLFAAVLGGVVSGMDGLVPTFKNLANNKVVIKMQTDSAGNRKKTLELDLD